MSGGGDNPDHSDNWLNRRTAEFTLPISRRVRLPPTKSNESLSQGKQALPKQDPLPYGNQVPDRTSKRQQSQRGLTKGYEQ
jgi:hypothetical protein